MYQKRLASRKVLQRKLCFVGGCVLIVAILILGLVYIYFHAAEIILSARLTYNVSFVPQTRNTGMRQPRMRPNRMEATSKQYAVFACSITSPIVAYCFYAPILTAAWRRLGYHVIVIFVGDYITLNGTKPAHARLAAEWVVRFGGTTYDFQCDEAYAIKVSQIIRVFVGFLPFSFINDDDFLLTTDADLMPLRRDQYLLRKDYPDGFIVNRWCCGPFQQRNKTYMMFPMGHVHIQRKVWRVMILESTLQKELVNIYSSTKDLMNKTHTSLLLPEAPLSFETISLYLRQEFGTLYDSSMNKGDKAWSMDQTLVTMLLVDYWNTTTQGQQLKIDERTLLPRLDRHPSISAWLKMNNYNKFGDAHLTHAIFDNDHWHINNHFFKTVFNASTIEQIDDYARTYLLLPLAEPSTTKPSEQSVK